MSENGSPSSGARGRDEIMLPPEVAARLRVDVSTLSTWRSTGRGPAWFRLGKKKVAYLESAVDAWLAEQVRIAEEQQREHRRPPTAR